VSDTSPWQSPSGQIPPPPPSYGTPPPAGGMLPPAPPLPQFGGPPGWTPPPRPGLIPLAPMTLGVIYSGAFRVLRRNPRPVVGISLAIHAILAVITIASTALIAAHSLTSYVDDISSGNVGASIGDLVNVYAAGFISNLFTYGGEAILQGIITQEVARGTLGERLPLRALWSRSRGRILVLVGWAALEVGAFLVAVAVLVGIIVLLVSGGSGAGIGFAILIGIVGGLGLIVVAVLVSTRLSLVPSVLILERLTLGKAIARSWGLVRGFFWRTFGIELLTAVMLGVASSIAILPFTLIVTLIFGIAHPTGQVSSGDGLTSAYSVSQLVTTIIGALIATITAIVSTAVTALIYIDLRIRKEGLDLALMRFVDAESAGSAEAADPYLPAASAPPTV
jgi:hypothetical protein